MTTKTIKMLVLAVAGWVTCSFAAQAEDFTVEVGTTYTPEGGGSDHIIVPDGASVDIANVGADSAYTFTIAGNGVDGKGAIYDSSTNDTVTNTIAGLTLSSNALVKVDRPWGVRGAEVGGATLNLKLFTLTKEGAASFSLENIAVTRTGWIEQADGLITVGDLKTDTIESLNYRYFYIIVHKDATLVYANENTTPNTRIVLREGATLRMDVALQNAHSPTWYLEPSVANPVVISGSGSINNTSSKFRVLASSLGPTETTPGEKIVLVKNETATSFDSNDFTSCMGSRFNVLAIAATEVTTTMKDGAPENLLHADFEGGWQNARGSAVALDSGSVFQNWANATAHAQFAPAAGGRAVLLSSDNSNKFLPEWYNGGADFVSPGVMTVTSLIRPVATDKRMVWMLGPGDEPPLRGLVVENSNTLALVAWKDNSLTSQIDLARVTDIPNLTNAEHFVVAKFTGRGTTLIVDGVKDETDAVAPLLVSKSSVIGGSRMAGYVSGTYKNQPKEGCWLNDWQLYTADLTDDELDSILYAIDPTAMSTLNATGGTVSFDAPGNWADGKVPLTGEIMIEIDGQTTVNLQTARKYRKVWISGSGSLVLTGEALTADEFVVMEGVTFRPGASGTAQVTVQDGASLDVANLGADTHYAYAVIGRGVNGEGAIFSSADASVDAAPFIRNLTLTGDALIRVDLDKPWGIAAPDGESATLTLDNWVLTKEGKGVFFVDHVGTASKGRVVIADGSFTMGEFLHQTKTSGFFSTNDLKLDIQEGATFDYNNTQVATGIKATVSAGAVFAVNVALNNTISPTFTLRATEVTPVTIGGTGSILSTSGKFILNAALLDHTKALAGAEIVLVVNEMESDFQANDFTSYLGARFNAATVAADQVVTTVVAGKLPNKFHYDFEGTETAYENKKGSSAAIDSTQIFGSFGGKATADAKVAAMRVGQAILLNAYAFLPEWFDSSTLRFNAGIGTITTVMKPVSTDNRAVWSFGAGDVYPQFALVVENDNTLAVVAWENNRTTASKMTLARVTGIEKLTTAEHFVAVKFNGKGTTLIVDGLEELTDETTQVLPVPRSATGKFGGIRGFGYNQPGDKNNQDVGCWLNDWQVYDAVLTDDELAKIHRKFWPSGLSIILR